MNVLLEDLALSCLGVSEVHHLVHEFVDDDKVVADGLFLELLEVFYEYGHKAVEKENNLGSICVAF